MKMQRPIRIMHIMLVVILLIIASSSYLILSADIIQEKAASSNQQEEFKKLLENQKVANNAIKLKLDHIISDKPLLEKDIYFTDLSAISIDNNNSIYACDTRQCKIFVFDIQGNIIRHIGNKGQGPGEFNLPTDVFNDIYGNMYVNNMGNGRIDIFNNSGIYIRSFKKYKSYKNMCIDKNKMIYANYSSSKVDEENLIEVLSDRGDLIRSFGKRISFAGGIANPHNQVILTIADNKYIYAVWSYFNVFRKYTLDGTLLVDTKIKNNNIEKISENNSIRMKPVDGTVTGTVLFTGAYYYDGKMYLLRSYPRIEIYECDDNGNIKNTYWADIEYDYIGRHLRVVNIQGEIKIITLQRYPEGSIEIYSMVSN